MKRGLIGVTVDPGFPERPYIYVCYVAKEPYPHHVISRFTADDDVARTGSELQLLVGDDQRTLGGNVAAGHQGVRSISARTASCTSPWATKPPGSPPKSSTRYRASCCG